MSGELRHGASHMASSVWFQLVLWFLTCNLAPTAVPSVPLQRVARINAAEMEM